MQSSKDYWNQNNSKYIDKKSNGWQIPQDNWLDKYQACFPKNNNTVLELGCGMGITTEYLIKKGFSVIATDISDVALNYVNNLLPDIKTLQMDMQNPFPFKDGEFEIIFADLCLHYFDDKTTKKIMLEIKRVLKPNGVLLARINSAKDAEAINANETRRFFTKAEAEKLFGNIGKTTCTETEMTRHLVPKKTIEILVQKK